MDYQQYIDKYFLRAKEILIKDNLNPTVLTQQFIRQGNCKVYGLNEAIQFITDNSNIQKNGHIWSLQEGDKIINKETIMLMEAPIQDIIDLETKYLGIIARETTLRNDKIDINLKDITEKVEQIKQLIGDRKFYYYGARHWGYERDKEIAKACFYGGADGCSTDWGALSFNQKGIGTIPHALQTIYHWKYGLENAVVSSLLKFDLYINDKIPRIALIDYANREINDLYKLIEYQYFHNLDGIRIDTCGENWIEGVLPYDKADRGVSIKGVYLINKLLQNMDNNIKVTLSSGFGDIKKVQKFIDAEKYFKIKLFDSLGVGGLYHSRISTMDIVKVEDKWISKVGRGYRPNKKLVKIF